MKQALEIIKNYITCEDASTRNKFYNLLDSFWHKDDGDILKSHTVDQAGNITFTFLKKDGSTYNVNLPALPNSKPISFITGLSEALNNLVQKVPGKGLSTNDLSTELLNKLVSLENYQHPLQHTIAEVEGLGEELAGKQPIAPDGWGFSQENYSLGDKAKVDSNFQLVSDHEIRIGVLEGMQLVADMANQKILIRNSEGILISEIAVGWLNNEGTTFFYNDVTEMLELKNDAGEVLSEIPASSFVSNLAKSVALSGSTFQLKDTEGNVISSVVFEIANINGLAAALSDKMSKGEMETFNQFRSSYFLSKHSGDLEAAISEINQMVLETGDDHLLVIDQDVELTGPARTITVPDTVPVVIQSGYKIITPTVYRTMDGLNPIVGTVAENYVQIEFEGEFIAAKNKQVFEGDGLIWFRKQSTRALYPAWWGMNVNDSTTAVQDGNVKAWQQAVNAVVLNKSFRSTSLLRLPKGDIYVNAPVVAASSGIESHPYLTGRRINASVAATILHIEGPERIKHGVEYKQTANIYYTANWGAPLMLQGLRNSEFKYIKWKGINDYKQKDSTWRPAGLDEYTALVLRPDDFHGGENGWILDNIVWSRTQPYAAIITDPFRTTVAEGGFSATNFPETTLDLYYGVTSHQNCWDVLLQGHHSTHFVSWLVNTLTGQQGDTYIYRDIMIDSQPIGVSTCQDQSRDCKAYEFMAYVGVWAAFEGNCHGAQIGIMPEIQSFHTAGGLKYLTYSPDRNRGIVKIDSVYAEMIYSVGVTGHRGKYLEGGGIKKLDGKVSAFPAVITNSTFKFPYAGSYVNGAGQESWLPRPATISGFKITGTLLGSYGAGNDTTWKVFRDCDISGATMGTNAPRWTPVDEGWFDSHLKATLIREGKRGATVADGLSIETPMSGNVGYESGKFVSRVAQDHFEWETVSYSLDETLVWRQLTNSATVTVFQDRHCFEVSGIDTTGLKVGDPITVGYTGVFGAIVKVEATKITVANLSLSDMDILATKAPEGSYTDFVSTVKFNKSHHPFVATNGANPNEINVVKYGQFGTMNVSYSKIEAGHVLRMPDNKDYFVLSVSGDVVTFDRDYTGPALNNVWVSAKHPSYKSIIFKNTYALNTYFSDGTFFEKGQKYKYYERDVPTTDYVVCVKTGDMGANAAPNNQYNANFLRYNEHGKLVDYIAGSESTTAGIKHVIFHYSGTTANRPDNLGIPAQYIPNGYTYKNTDTGKTEIWEGASFQPLGADGNYVEGFKRHTFSTGANTTLTNAAFTMVEFTHTEGQVFLQLNGVTKPEYIFVKTGAGTVELLDQTYNKIILPAGRSRILQANGSVVMHNLGLDDTGTFNRWAVSGDLGIDDVKTISESTHLLSKDDANYWLHFSSDCEIQIPADLKGIEFQGDAGEYRNLTFVLVDEINSKLRWDEYSRPAVGPNGVFGLKATNLNNYVLFGSLLPH